MNYILRRYVLLLLIQRFKFILFYSGINVNERNCMRNVNYITIWLNSTNPDMPNFLLKG